MERGLNVEIIEVLVWFEKIMQESQKIEPLKRLRTGSMMYMGVSEQGEDV